MCPNPQFPAYLVTFTEEILNGKLHFLRSVRHSGTQSAFKYAQRAFKHLSHSESTRALEGYLGT